jgi:hypothetical protein
MITPQRPSISVPHLFVIDQNGYIRNDFGHSEANKSILEGSGLESEIARMLNARSVPTKPSVSPQR